MSKTTIPTGGLTDAAVSTAKITDSAVTLGKVDATSTEANNLKQRVAKVWCNLDATGTFGISDSFNVSGATDNGTGDHTVTYDVDFGNANHSVVALADGGRTCDMNDNGPAAGSVRIRTVNSGNSAEDANDVCMIAFGDS